MRRLLTLAALLVLASHAAVNAGTLDRIRDTGVFRIGYRADARPYSFQDRNGQPSGYIVDLCVEVAAALGPNVRPQYVLVPADRRFEAVRDGTIDILCDPSSATLPRREIVDFSLPTFIDGAGVISRIGKPVRDFEDLGGKRIGVLGGTTSEATLRKALGELKLNATIVLAPDHRAGLDLLTGDKVDVYFADRGIIAAMLREGGRPGFEISKQYFSYETYALALPRDDGAFRLLVDRTLARLYRTGKIDAILQKTFGKTPSDELLKAMIIMNALPD
jgi:polar amino acid transport system substrate-binding protein